MKNGLYAKLAFGSIRRNGTLYLPYFATCILMVSVFYIMHFLGYSDIMKGMPGGSTAIEMMRMGTWIMTFFSVIFLFYTQSTLIRNRKKEFGLYSILGMNKWNLGRILFFDTLMTWMVSIAAGLGAGIGLSKLAQLGFSRMVHTAASYGFKIPGASVGWTMLIFSAIFLALYLNSVRQIRFSTAIELVRADQAGEKPPKSNWLAGILGLIILGAGYGIALKIQQPLAALLYFFAAVLLVMIGTYLLMIAGSVLFCRMLQKNKAYYYQTKHFVSVSSMVYRMKRNGAGLASICILLTAVLVMLSSTSALYFNADKCLTVRYPNEIGAFACRYGYDEGLSVLGERLDNELKNAAEEYGAEIADNKTYSEYSVSGYFKDGKLDITLNSKSNLAFIDYDKVVQVLFLDVEEYNRVFGYSETVAPGEALVGTTGKLATDSVITVGEVPFRVAGRIDDRVEEINAAAAGSVSPSIYMIVGDVQEVASHYIKYQDYDGEPMLAWFWHSNFNTGLDEGGQIALADTLQEKMRAELDQLHFNNFYCESHAGQRDDFVSTFGGLFFLGIMLSIVFLVSCVIIIYYKQVSEGFEDKSRFAIMQKVGMTETDIRKSINSQMLTVFFVPIGFACLHLIAVLPIIHKLLMLFGLFDTGALVQTAAVCVLLCMLLYIVIYRLTSRTYYRIVK